jgi:hypothetical protein
MVQKLSESQKAKYLKTLKGKVYIFIIEANQLAYENLYTNMLPEMDVRDMNTYIDNKLNYIFNEQTGAYWREDFRGFDAIYEAAKNARQDIINQDYSVKVMQFLEAAIRSYLPKGEKRAEEIVVIPAPTEVGKIIDEGVTGKQLEKQKNQELAQIEEIENLQDLDDLDDLNKDEFSELQELEEEEFEEEEKVNPEDLSDDL